MVVALHLMPMHSVASTPAWVSEVYQRLTTTMGLIHPPNISVDPMGATNVAAMHYARHEIVVDRKFIQLLEAQFPLRKEDGLAFVLGHELAHYQYDHHWGDAFASAYGLTEIVKDISAAQAQLAQLPLWETQADQMGGIYTYLAGYHPVDMAEPLLQAIYEAYQFPETMQGYPSLQDRIEIAKANEKKIKDWISIYETANFALLSGAYEVADYCYTHVLQAGFVGREVLNNHAVSLFQQAVAQMDAPALPYLFPIEIDLSSRLEQHRGATNAQLLLERAARRLWQAIWLDPEFATSWLNLACVKGLQGHWQEARFYWKKATQLATAQQQHSTLLHAQVMEGILAVAANDQKEAIRIWQKAAKDGSLLAQKNLAIAKGKTVETIIPVLSQSPSPAIEIDGINLPKEWGTQSFLTTPLLTGRRNLYLCVALPGSRLYFFQEKGSRGYVFHTTLEGYKAPLTGTVTIGQNGEKLQKVWGAPTTMLSTAQGEVWHYPAKGILVLLDAAGTIYRWVTYIKT